MKGPQRTGILGGTFDPIHLGHVKAAEVARRTLDLDVVLILPSLTPPHRTDQPRASAFHRFAMAALAVSGLDGLVISDLELRAEGPSYTSLTLQHLHRSGTAAGQLYFILGSDAFVEVKTWHDYPALLDLCHFLVISRPGTPVDRLPIQLPDLAERMRPVRDAGQPSATSLIFLVNADTPDVSSTEVRRQIAAGESIEEMVGAPVADHIRRHRLYVA